MPLDGCHNLHRWTKEQKQRRQSGKPPSDPNIPGLLGFEKDQDLKETKVYIRALWLATENARVASPTFLNDNAQELCNRTSELVREFVRDEERLCAELGKDEIVQTDSALDFGPASSEARVCSAFLKKDVEHILIDEGFGELIWGKQSAAYSQLSNPCPGNGERAPRWGAWDREGKWRRNEQDMIILTVRWWVAARIQNKIKALPRSVKSGGRRVKQKRSQGIDAKKSELKTHRLPEPQTHRHDSPNEQLAREHYTSSVRDEGGVLMSTVHEQEYSVETSDTATSTDESPSKIQLRKRKRSIQNRAPRASIPGQSKDNVGSARGIQKLQASRKTAPNDGFNTSALQLNSKPLLSQKALNAPVLFKFPNGKTDGKSQRPPTKGVQPFSHLHDASSSTDKDQSFALNMFSTEPTSECSSVDFAQFLDADDELSDEGFKDLPATGYTKRRTETCYNEEPIKSAPGYSQISTTNSDIPIVRARIDLRASLYQVIHQQPSYHFILDILIPRAKLLYKALTIYSPEYYFPLTFEQYELALVYWEVLIRKLHSNNTLIFPESQHKRAVGSISATTKSQHNVFNFSSHQLRELKTWHQRLLEPWPDRRSFGLECWTRDLVLFFQGVLGSGNLPVPENEMVQRLAQYNEGLWDCFVGSDREM